MATIDVHRWVANHNDADPSRRVLVFPGMRYPIGMPLLFMPSVALAEAGWTVWHVDWDLTDLGNDEDALWGAVTTAADRLGEMAGVDQPGQTLLLAKSVGTLACTWARQYELSGVWLTPLIRGERVMEEEIAANPSSALVVGGDADRSWDAQAALRTGKATMEIGGGDHALYSGSWRRYLRTLERVTDATLKLAEAVVHS